VPRGSTAPGEPIGSGFSALIFFGSFLYQDKKEHLTCSLPKFCHGDEKNPSSSLEKPLLASPKLPWPPLNPGFCPGLSYYVPSGLLFPHSPGSSFQTYSAPSGLVKIVRSIQGAVPLATYYAPLGLKPPDKFRREADKF